MLFRWSIIAEEESTPDLLDSVHERAVPGGGGGYSTNPGMDRFHSDVLRNNVRLAAVRHPALSEAAAREAFDRLARLGTRVLGVPVALVSLVEEDRQVFRGCVGLPEPWASERETPLSHSFCQHVVSLAEPLIVEDAREHPELRENFAIRDLGVVAYAGFPLITSGGQVLGSFCAIDTKPRQWSQDELEILRDLAASVMTEIELRDAAHEIKQEQRQRFSVLEATDEGIYGIDREGRCTFLNPAGAQVIGYTPDEVIGRNMHALIHHQHPDGSPYPEDECPIYQALRTGKGVRVEDDVLWRKDGSAVPVTYASFPRRADGMVEGAVVTFRDITERRRVEDELRRREERYRLATRATNDVIWDWDLHSDALTWNQALERVFDYPLEEVQPTIDWWYDRIHPEDRERVTSRIHAALRSGAETWSEEYRFRQRDGTYAEVLDRGFIARNERGEAVRMIGSMLDVTEQRRREQAERFLSEASRILVSSLNFDITLRGLVDLLVPRLADACGIHLTAEDGSVLQTISRGADPATTDLVRELLDQQAGGTIPSGPAADALDSGETVFCPESGSGSGRQMRTETGQVLEALGPRGAVAVPLIARGHSLGVLSLYLARSDRQLTPDKVRLIEEVARRTALAVDNARLLRKAEWAQTEAEAANRAKSEFLASMSHELRTPINAVVGYAQLLEMGIAGPVSQEQQSHLQRIRTSSQHLLSLVDDVLDLAKIESGRMTVQKERVNISVVVQAALDLVLPQASAAALELAGECEPGAGTFYGDADRVRQILVNLLSNAVKFTEPGGRIRIACGTADRAEPAAQAREGGPWVFVQVEDTGIGIAPEQLEAVFQPFVQAETGHTRRRGGTGLGLSISRQFARLMGGDLTAQSRPGTGSCFTLWLPAG